MTLLAKNTYTGNGSTTDFVYPPELLTGVAVTAQIKVYVDGIDTSYTVDAVSYPGKVRVSPAPDDGAAIVVVRETQITSQYVSYTDNSIIDDTVLNLDSDQMFYLIQENRDMIGDALIKEPGGSYWEGEGLEIKNLTPGTGANSAVTVGQMDAAIAGVTVTTIDNVSTWLYTGNGSTTDFNLGGAPTGLTDAKQLFVYVSGVRQTHGTDYTLTAGSPPVLTIDPAPPSGASVYINLVTGDTVAATVGNGEITTAKIADDAVTLAKIDAGTHDGTKTRFLKVLADGTPEKTAISVSQLDNWPSDLYTYRWGLMADPNAAVGMNGQKLTNLGTGTDPNDAVNKAQMEAAITANSNAFVSVGSGTLTGAGTTSTGPLSDNFAAVLVSFVGQDNNPYTFLFNNGTSWEYGASGETANLTWSDTTFYFTGGGASTNFSYIAFANS
jgi:hypothetical protein